MRKPIIAGNWKMHKVRDEALEFVYLVSQHVPPVEEVDTVICAQAVLLRSLVKRQGDNLRIGAQNMFYEDKGAYTGEVSPVTLEDAGVKYVIIGHSERRQYFHETDEDVNKKVHAAFRHDLIPIVCVGERLEERENNLTNQVVERQTVIALKGLTKEQVKQVVIAYEPVWAIGTGRTATAQMANETCGYIRSVVEREFGKEVADEVRIQYGGSVNPDNIKELMAQEHIDGCLIGGASLDPYAFIKMANYKKL
ncbi:MAG: triose-phosphate isomerase [Bacilli bacterium]|nr:triose-phosphate isomerase [Bacilli bacterium]